MKKILVLPVLLLLLSSLACNLAAQTPSTPTPDLASMVNATLTAVAAQVTPVPPPTDTAVPAQGFFPATGFISGKLSYPSEFIPPLRIVAFNMADGSTAYMETPENQFEYTFELPVGEWTVVAYVISGDGTPGLSAGYSAAVPCGLSVDCTDHGLLIVTVKEGETTPNVDPTDWYAPEGTFPPMP